MSVAKPWIDASPAPDTSHTEAGLPASWFSVTMAFCAIARPGRPMSRARVSAAAHGKRLEAGAAQRRKAPPCFTELMPVAPYSAVTWRQHRGRGWAHARAPRPGGDLHPLV